jgi:hypothetical protein
MDKRIRIHYNTTLDVELLKRLKFLSIELNKRHNDILEEAIADLLKKYEKKPKNNLTGGDTKQTLKRHRCQIPVSFLTKLEGLWPEPNPISQFEMSGFCFLITSFQISQKTTIIERHV